MEITESLILTRTGSGELSPSLTNQEAKVVLSARGERIKDLKKKVVANKITELFGAALVVINHSNKIGSEDRIAMEQVIVADLFEKFGNFTLKEVENAFWMGTRGELKNRPEDIVFMSIAQVYQWLNNYRITVKRESMKKQVDFEAKKEYESVEEKKKNALLIVRNDLIKAYNDFKQGLPIYDPINVLYDHLDKLGLVMISNVRKKEIYNRCLEEFTAKHKNINSIEDYAASKKILEEIEKGSSMVQAKVKILAKQKAIQIVFNDINELGLTMEEYLEKN
jgi:hypothetical protein